MFETLAKNVATLIRRRGPTWRATPWSPRDARSASQKSLLRILAIAHQERLDPGTLIANLASEYRGLTRRRLNRLAKRVLSGTPLIAALEQTPDALSDQDVLAIRFGIQSGTLLPTLESLLQRTEETASRTRANLQEVRFYFGMLFVVTVAILCFLFLMIVPKLVVLINDYGAVNANVPQPWALSRLIWIFEHVSDQLAWLSLIAIALYFVFEIGPVRRFFRRTLAARLCSPIVQLRAADLLGMLSIATDAGRPMPAALSTLARYHFDSDIRARLLFARNEIEQGADTWQSLTQSQLLSAEESRALAMATSSDSRAWTMRRLADWKRQQVFERLESIAQFAQPLGTLLLASVVLFVACSMFQFLTHIIFSLSL